MSLLFRLHQGRLFGLTNRRVTLLVILSMSAALFEGIGLASFLPVMEFIENGRDVSALAGKSRIWQVIVAGFHTVGLDVSLLGLIACVVILMNIRVGLVYARQVYQAWLGHEVRHNIRAVFFDAFINAGGDFYNSCPSGHMMNISITESQRTGAFFAALFLVFANAMMLLGYLGVLLWVSPAMTGAALVVGTIGGGIVLYAIRHSAMVGKNATDFNNDFAFMLIERLNAVRLIKFCNCTERESKFMREMSLCLRDALYLLQKLKARIDLLLEPLVMLVGLSTIYLAVSFFHFSLSQVGLFLLILLRIMPLGKELLKSWQTMQGNAAGVDAVTQGIADARKSDEFVSPPGTRSFRGLKKNITLTDVTFTYPEGAKPALNNVTLTIPAGAMTALIGPSGAGKSTLGDLLPRLLVPQHGLITFDGCPAKEYDLGTLRREMANVSQDTVIFNASVLDNLLFVRADASIEEVLAALDKARAREFVEALPQGLETIVGERGAKLSGGQRQRLSLARAFLQRSSILILDEPTSALDSEVEQDIQEAITEIKCARETTIIIIAHRMSTIRMADKIVVFKDGIIVQEGTHDELMASGDWYAMVRNLQTR